MKEYVSAAYISIGIISAALILIFLATNIFIPWPRVFNAEEALSGELSILMPAVFSLFFIQLTLKLVISIQLADQRHSAQAEFNFFSQLLSLALIIILSSYGTASLMAYSIAVMAAPTAILILYNILSFRGKYFKIRPALSAWSPARVRDIFSLGSRFLIIQISGIAIFSSGSLIISNLLGPGEVVPYTLAFQYFGIATMLYSIVLAPYWSASTDAYARGDSEWIKKSMAGQTKLSMALIALTLIMAVFADIFYRLWVGSKVEVPASITYWMAVYVGITIFYSPYTYFLNGIGKVKLQMYSLVVTGLLSVPLAVFFIIQFEMGASGVIAAMIVSVLPHAILSPVQFRKIMSQRARGIWNA
jgi:O-antigen/teichoic acid export membrane protein